MHPDRLGGATSAELTLAERRMREINEAWQVLQDPVRRRAYDDGRLQRSRTERTAAGRPSPRAPSSVPVQVDDDDDDDLVDVLPPMTALTAGLFRHLPWVVLVLVFGVIFVLTAYAGGGSSDQEPAVGSVAGTCVDVVSGPSTTVVPCDGPHQLEIVARVDEATACPEGSDRRRLDDDGLLDCVVSG